MSITIKKIAELAGVSRGTVDRALNNRGGVNKTVEKKIKAIAKQHGYRPNLAAKSLAMKSQKLTIGIIIYSKSNEFFDIVIDGINKATNEIREFGVSVVISKLTGFDVEEQLHEIDNMLNLDVNAIAITPINDPRIIKKLETIKTIPVIALNTDIEGNHNADYIGCDYYKSGQTAGAMMGLFSKGIGKVLIITGSNIIYGHRQRVAGFCDVLSNEYPNVNIVETIENKDDNNLSYSIVSDSIKKDKTINGFYFAAGGADGGVKALIEDSRCDNFIIITNDTSTNTIEHIKSGIIDATICQQPYEQGYNCVKELFNCIMNNRLTKGKKYYTNIGIKLKYNFN